MADILTTIPLPLISAVTGTSTIIGTSTTPISQRTSGMALGDSAVMDSPGMDSPGMAGMAVAVTADELPAAEIQHRRVPPPPAPAS
jgi:hypothetical protein